MGDRKFIEVYMHQKQS